MSTARPVRNKVLFHDVLIEENSEQASVMETWLEGSDNIILSQLMPAGVQSFISSIIENSTCVAIILCGFHRVLVQSIAGFECMLLVLGSRAD